MSAPVVAFPDAELIVVNYLNDHFAGSVDVCTVLPADYTGLTPIIRAVRIGGVWRFRKVADEPTVDFNVWGPDLKAVNDLAAELRGAVEAMVGTADDGGVVVRTYEVTGPGRRPDENAAVYRVGFTAALIVRAL